MPKVIPAKPCKEQPRDWQVELASLLAALRELTQELTLRARQERSDAESR